MIENQEYFIEYKTPEVKAIRASWPGKGHDEIFKDLIQTVGVYLTRFTVFFLEILKIKSSEKKALKMTSQLVIFRAFFSSPRP